MKGAYPRNLAAIAIAFIFLILFLATMNFLINIEFRSRFIELDRNRVMTIADISGSYFTGTYSTPDQTRFLHSLANAFELEYFVLTDTLGNVIFDSRRQRHPNTPAVRINWQESFRKSLAGKHFVQERNRFLYLGSEPPMYYFMVLSRSYSTDFDRVFIWHVVFITLSLFVAGVLGIIVIRNLLTPMRYVSKAAEDFGIDMEKEGFVAETFNQIFKKLQHREKMLVEFSAYIAHEFRNSIGTIAGFARLVEKGKKSASAITDECRVMEDLIQRFVEYARPLKLVAANLQVSNLIGDVLARITVPEKIKIDVDVPRDLCVHADYELLFAAVANLLRNAVESIENKGTISIQAGEDNGNVYVAIRDSGIGIETLDLETIFNPFYSKKDQGMGLGLAYVKKIVEMHGGKIEVQSEPGQGTEFTLWLPKNAGSGK